MPAENLDDRGHGVAGDAVSGSELRAAFRSLAAGVVVVTTWVDGRPWGLTVNSCCSISTEPARVLVSIQRRTRTCAAIKTEGRFGLGILGAEQKHVAESAALAGQPKFIDSFCDPRNGDLPPAIRSAMWHLVCVVHRSFQVGDHTLFVADVIDAKEAQREATDRDPEPLLYFNRAYRLIGRQL